MTLTRPTGTRPKAFADKLLSTYFDRTKTMPSKNMTEQMARMIEKKLMDMVPVEGVNIRVSDSVKNMYFLVGQLKTS